MFAERPGRQRGVTFLISLIMLTLMILFVVSTINLSNLNSREITALQARSATQAAAQQAIAQVVSRRSSFAAGDAGRVPDPGAVGINGMQVVVEPPTCLASVTAPGYDLNNPLAPQDTSWDVKARATDPVRKVEVVVHEGFRIRMHAGNCP